MLHRAEKGAAIVALAAASAIVACSQPSPVPTTLPVATVAPAVATVAAPAAAPSIAPTTASAPASPVPKPVAPSPASSPAAAANLKDYILAPAKPNGLALMDVAARQVVRMYTIPGPGNSPAGIAPSPDGKRAYVLTNYQQSISGIDLDSGDEVFRADLSSPGLRVVADYAFTISPDSRELYVFESPTRLGLDELQPQDTRIAVFNTAAGVGAQPVRTFSAPRRIGLLVSSLDGSTLYALGWDLYAFDPQTGAIKNTYKVLNWDRANFAPPDMLNFWPDWEQSGVFAAPYFAVRTDLPADNPDAAKTGLLTLDLKTGAFDMSDYESTSVGLFTATVSPTEPNLVFEVYATLSKVDRFQHQLLQRVDLPHSYYSINISSDGQEVYVGGTQCDVGVYSTATLAYLASIQIPGCPDMGQSGMRMIRR